MWTDDLLAPYAQRTDQTAGRAVEEPPHPLRSCYERDRARIIHTRAFRRLEYKTQVFLNGTGDHLRTRLTHTIEVASITRSIARALRLNEDLAESIALAHDLGHSPFGHCGEDALDECMRGHGGFEHNQQSLRIVSLIECKRPGLPGLNLSWEVLEGLHKHSRLPVHPVAGVQYPSPSIEAQIANLADEIAYSSHDIEDGIDEGLLTEALLETLPVWAETRANVLKHHPHLEGPTLQRQVIRDLTDSTVDDLIAETRRRLTEGGFTSAESVRKHEAALAAFSPAVRARNQELRRFLFKHLYRHPTLNDVNERGREILRHVFGAYVAEPNLLGQDSFDRIAQEGLERTVCDYVSGMTDRFALEEYRRLSGKTA